MIVQLIERRGPVLTQQRKAHILDVLRRDGQVVAKTLSQTLALSEDTIRRDLRELAAEGLLQRVHGGALPASPAVADFAHRQHVGSDGKAAIGRVAAGMVRSGQVVFLDGGTTSIQLVRHLPPDLNATIVTHSPNVAVELVGCKNIMVEMIGGRLFKHSIVTVGAATIEAIRRIRPDIYFMGVTGIHPEFGLTTGDAEEAAVKRMLSQLAGETVVLASLEKIGAVSPHVIVGIDEVETIIVEKPTPQAVIDTYRSLNLSVTVA
jgi:DeoR/GlpR family transcriptional regulator of sugar metabolism